MTFTSGSCLTINEFLDDLMVYAQAQGWTLLRGSASLSDSGVFPLSTRYLRVKVANALANVGQSESSSTMRIAGMTIRATAGGADLSLSSANLTASGYDDISHPPANVLDGLTTTQWYCEPDDVAYLYYDFGATQTIREFTFSAESTSGTLMPRDFEIARSDDGINWDTVHVFPTVSSWTAGETKTFTLPVDTSNFASSTASGGVRRPVEYWLQGPGYDAARRVYLGFRSHYDLVTGYGGIELNAATAFDSNELFENQENCVSDFPRVNVYTGGETCNYWIYISSIRIIGVLQTAAGDYACFYAGFLAAFGNPDEYPFPLFLGGTTTETLDKAWDTVNAANSNFWDPGTTGARVMDQLGVWQNVGNQANTSGTFIDPIANPSYFIWPWPLGYANTQSMPYSLSGNTNGNSNGHWLEAIQPTLQNDLPVFDALVCGITYGYLGTLQGVVGIPGGGLLVAEDVITINAANYDVFPNRTRRLGNHWIAIAE